MAIKSTICAVENCSNPRDLKQRSSLCIMHRARRSKYKSYNLPNNPNEFDDSVSFESIKRGGAGTGKICSITNCETKIWKYGTICSKHHWRLRKYGSYDLPDYKGEPNAPVLIILPEGILKRCSIHGNLTEDKVYPKKYKGKINSYNCKECTINRSRHKKFNGMSKNDYQILSDKQNGVCKICKKTESTQRNGITKKMAIDHDHSTGKVRGLLCQFCNSGLGYFQDSIETLQSAIDYLKSNS